MCLSLLLGNLNSLVALTQQVDAMTIHVAEALAGKVENLYRLVLTELLIRSQLADTRGSLERK